MKTNNEVRDNPGCLHPTITIIFIMALLLSLACGTPKPQPQTQTVLHTFVIIQSTRTDTIVAEEYQIGNFPSFGHGVLFFTNNKRAGAILYRSGEDLIIKPID